MASCDNSAEQGNFTFGQGVSGFLTSPGLPVVDILCEQRIAGVFKKHKGLLGHTYTTAIVLRTFMSQVLRDGKDAAHYENLAELFGFRWKAELDLRSLKTHMNLNHPGCKPPEDGPQGILGGNAGAQYDPDDGSGQCLDLRHAAPRGELSQSLSIRAGGVGRNRHQDEWESTKLLCHPIGAYRQVPHWATSTQFEPRVRIKRGSNCNLMMQTRATLRARLAVGDNSFETK
ncbi:hypothetical protein [Aureliella helgolandensis]|uniref:Uncharacterized protein n=1 Tax=Aureliella helgolandensis TaxID=2527968 RepID=A0A518G9T7_9BACT|nr:hypothetical protein [Aureliella helgolandensis]QDV25342.1 hypothetical protein Q31a_36670 [Aureliella helgolandensis]